MNAQVFLLPYFSGRRDGEMAYFRYGLSQYLKSSGGSYSEVSLVRCPRLLHFLARARDSYSAHKALGKLKGVYRGTIDLLARVIGGKPRRGSVEFGGMTGVVLFQLEDGTEVKACIDLLDAGDLNSPEALAACDLYFKTSFWKERSYPTNVVPFYQCSFLLRERMDHLRAMRGAPKNYDLCFTTRVWGGSNDVEGIEHNLRILEALAKVKCKKYLRAYLIAGDKASYARRLDKHDIPWSFDPLPWAEHWNVLASSRLNNHRLGMHRSMTWRMSELLCMGACPVLDQHPATLWPAPLREHEHYLTLNVAPPPGRWVAADEQYEAIPDRVAQLLSDPSAIGRIANNNQVYFDQHLEPCALGRQICEQVLRRKTTTPHPGATRL